MKAHLALLLSLFYAGGVLAYPVVNTSEHKSYSKTSIYTDGYQVSGVGTLYSYYREKQPNNTWGPQRELKMGEAAVRTALSNQTIMLEGYNEVDKRWYGYYGAGNDLAAHNTNYGWNYGYQLTFDGSFIKADIQIEFDWTDSGFTDDLVKSSHMSYWEQNIEHWWSGRYEVVKDDKWYFPIVFDVTYDGYDAGAGVQKFDQKVFIHKDGGRADVKNWYVTDGPQTNAHEFGHMLGLYDEYWLGAVDPTSLHTDYQNLMGANIGTLDLGTGLEDYYFSQFMVWLDSIDPDPTQTYRLQRTGIPEPGVLALFALGYLSLVLSRPRGSSTRH